MAQRIEVDKQLIYIKQKKTAQIVDADKLASHPQLTKEHLYFGHTVTCDQLEEFGNDMDSVTWSLIG